MALPEWEAEGFIWNEDYSLSLEEFTFRDVSKTLAGCDANGEKRTVRRASDSAMLDNRCNYGRKNKRKARKKGNKLKRPERMEKFNDEANDEVRPVKEVNKLEKPEHNGRFSDEPNDEVHPVKEVSRETQFDESLKLENVGKIDEQNCKRQRFRKWKQRRFEKGSRRLEDNNGPSSSWTKPQVNRTADKYHSQKDKNSSQFVDKAVMGEGVQDASQDQIFFSIFNGVVEEAPMRPICEEKGDGQMLQTRSLSFESKPLLDVEDKHVCATKPCISEKDVRRRDTEGNCTRSQTAKFSPSRASGVAVIKKLLELSIRESCNPPKQKSLRKKFRDRKGRRNNDEEKIMHNITSTTAADLDSIDASHLPREEKINTAVSSSKSPEGEDVKAASADAALMPANLITESDDTVKPNVLPDILLPPEVEDSHHAHAVTEKETDCSEEDVRVFMESSMLFEHDPRINRVLRVMADFLHPDGRGLQGLLGLNLSDFYRLCSFYSHSKFETLSELDFSKADPKHVKSFLEKIFWLCRSLMVGMLAKSALLAEDHLDFNHLDLDLCTSEEISERKEIEMLLGLVQDLRDISAIQSIDDAGYFTQFEQIRDVVGAFDCRDRRKLIQLGVVDTAERVSERIALGMNVSADEVMELLRDSISSNFGEYTWLVESHPDLISTMNHFDCIMDSIPSMARCIDIRPLRSTLSFVPRFLCKLSNADRDSCVAKYVGKYQIKEAGQSWLQLIRDAEDAQQLSLQITTQILFSSVDCGGEEFLGALLEDLPLQKKTTAIQSISYMPDALRAALIPTDVLTKCGLYHAVQRMAEEMPLTRFKSDAVPLIEQLCSFSTLSPSRLLSNTFFPLMSTSSKAKAVVAIASLVHHKCFKSETAAGTGLSAADLLKFALHYYEPTCDSVSTSRYAFIETVFRAVNTILRENEDVHVDFSAVFAHFEAIKWYHKFVILKFFFDTSVWSNVTFEYPWTDKAKDDVELFCEIPCILTAWPGDNSSLFESFICENFQSEDAEVISRSLLLAFDRGPGGNSDSFHLFARVVEKLSVDARDWERFLSEEEYKFQSVSFAQVFDCTGISFGFFDDEDVPSNPQIVRNADVETKTDLCVYCNAFISDSKAQCQFATSHLLDDYVFTAEEKTDESETRPFSSISKSTVTGSQTEQCDHFENVEIIKERSVVSSNSDVDKLLDEIIDKVADMCPAPYLERVSSKICQLSGSNDNYVTSVSGEGDAEYSKCIIENGAAALSDLLPSQIGTSVNENAKDNSIWTMERSCLSFDWEQSEGPKKDEILLDLRTFTWALDIIEEWEYCPKSLKDKVLLLALESRCEVIRKRARLLKEIDIDC
ncbi:unnamed protein product [Cylicocyclus nassatus]|uniref:Uncharacterized protein n=1 Tax=Cylicocyclus nassatus TaxID=53992 RepID=A0AA36DNR4_CYLNA|nr:unnamed protein product [Cylicocyclus nassatus]